MENKINISSERGLSYPKGFKVSSRSCNIKPSGNKDLGLLFCEDLCKCIGVFTQNQFKAHSVIKNISHLKNNSAKALIVNSGNANCLNGEYGYKGMMNVLEKTAEKLNLVSEDVLVASTGTIGETFPSNFVLDSVPELVNGLNQGKAADIGFAESMTTTDTNIKMASTSFKIKDKEVKISGVAKGSGMIKPDLATMLVFFTTDVNIDLSLLKDVFEYCINETFNNINIDSETSTNDMALIFANGFAKNGIIDKQDNRLEIFKRNFLSVCNQLAYEIVKDAEGSTKVVKINVRNAVNKKSAKEIANAVASSSLVKTSIYGEEPNWGRIVQAIGKTKIKIKPKSVVIKVNNVTVFKNEIIIRDSKRKDILKKDEVNIDIDLNEGDVEIQVLSCDLTPEYVHINSKY